jgi:Xaa-Pro aminopeptidase
MSVWRANRERLFSQIEDNSIVLICAGEEKIRNRDVEYPFRVNSDFRYLTGFCEPDSILVLVKKNNEQKALIFVRPKDKKQEIWQGRRLGVELAANQLSVDEAFALCEFAEKMEEIVLDIETIHFSFEQLSDWSEKISDWLGTQKAQVRQGITPTHKLQDVDSLLHELRLIKTPEEIVIMQKAAQISVQGHLAAMKISDLEYEYQVQARLESEFKQAGSPRVAFNSICASGENACILHYTENNAKLAETSLILVDAGAEYEGYAGDITTTFPKTGKFSTEQKELYDLVLKAQQAVIRMIKPNLKYDELHQCAERVITEGLIQLGVLSGKLETLLTDKAYKKFFMHGTGHWLGMDVHDVGNYKVNKKWRNLKPGMVLTVEPGLYISAEVGKEESIDKKYWDIGIRIEDDILVTEQGYQILTEGLPRTTQEIEIYMEQF